MEWVAGVVVLSAFVFVCWRMLDVMDELFAAWRSDE